MAKKIKPQRLQSLEKKIDGLGLLYYELRMLVSTVEEMATTQLQTGTTLSNAIVESFAIHLRLLISFLYDDEIWEDDVSAEQFMDGPVSWADLRPPMTDRTKTARGRVDKEIAHLSYRRLDLTPQTKLWEYGEEYNSIVPAINAFLAAVPHSMFPEDRPHPGALKFIHFIVDDDEGGPVI